MQKWNRKLILLPNLGFVKIKLTFDNGAFEFTSNPHQTTVISVFDEEKYGFKRYTIEELEWTTKLTR